MWFVCSSSGLLIYAALVDLLAEDFLSEEASHTMTGKKKMHGIFWVFMGGKSQLSCIPNCIHTLTHKIAIGMAIVGAFA